MPVDRCYFSVAREGFTEEVLLSFRVEWMVGIAVKYMHTQVRFS